MFYTIPFHNEQVNSFDQKVRQLTKSSNEFREARSICDEANVITIFNNTGFAIIFLIICIILMLLLMGVIKGLMGIYCCPPLGMCGLGALIDLPRPLAYYQETELQDFPVQYDIIGWPVHPQTGKRTVRAISIRTEFCLNVIFFLTYPMIMMITLCTFCCFSKVYDTADTNKGYKNTRTIMLTDCPSFILKRDSTKKCQRVKKPPVYYSDNDSAEESDTNYVLEQMRKSEDRLKFSK